MTDNIIISSTEAKRGGSDDFKAMDNEGITQTVQDLWQELYEKDVRVYTKGTTFCRYLEGPSSNTQSEFDLVNFDLTLILTLISFPPPQTLRQLYLGLTDTRRNMVRKPGMMLARSSSATTTR